MIPKRQIHTSLVLSGFLLFLWLGVSFAAELVDINSATPDQLKDLPGMTEGYIMMIVGARPFQSKEDLIEQKILPQDTYDQMKDRIFVKGGAARSSTPPATSTTQPPAMSGAEPNERREGADMSQPSGSGAGRVCIKEERTKQLMCGELVR